MTRPLAYVRRNPIPYLALLLVLAIGAGGGYALAASQTKTITVCADNKTGVLHLKTHGRCKSSQTRVTWNQQGPQGVQGPLGPQGVQGAQGVQGPAGAPGAPAVSVWAGVGGNGTVAAGQGLSVHRTMAGTYQVTVTDPTCSHELINAPVVSVDDSNPPGGQLPGSGAFAVAWYGALGPSQFTVFTGVVVNGKFSATDHPFSILDTCP
jgi:hypothetical protein